MNPGADDYFPADGAAAPPAAGYSTQEDGDTLALTPQVRAELLDSESWTKTLEVYASTTRVAVALVDSQGQVVGPCHNPQPIWKLARDARPDWGAACPFCLDADRGCTAAGEALRTNSLALVHDQGGFAHVALPLSLGDRHLGTLLAGQVFDRYPEPLQLERVAREFGLSAQRLWHLAREQAPSSRGQLMVYGDLLGTLGQAFLRQRYSAILERKLAETNKEFNQALETLNSELNRNVVELDSSRSDLQNLFDSSPIGTIFLDRALRIRGFTPAINTLVRLGPSDIGRRITDFADVLRDAGLAESLDEALRTLSIGSVQEHRMQRWGDGPGAQRQDFLLRILPYRTVHHVIDGTVMTFVDVTELGQAQQNAEEARIYAENIVATVREPLLVLDDNLRVRSANKAFYKKFQVSADETEGRVLYDLGAGEWDIPELRRLLREVLRRNQSVEDFEMVRDFTHQGPRTMLLNANRIDHVQLILLAIEDVTERKHSEQSLRNLNRDLKNFNYAASHDLQEPLRMVVSYTQLLARQYKGKLDPQADQFIGYAVEGGRRMERLLRALREYWLVSERQLERLTSLDSGRVMDQAIQTLEIPIRESGAAVSYEPMPQVSAEEVSLAMLFQNLLGNAVKYSRPGEPPRIHVAARKNANMWEFSIGDNGIGIEAEHLEAIFAPFKRLHGSEYPGSGIGLSLCQKIVERYGGRIWAESTYGQGSTFYFTVPA